eukprot:2754851-Heterocapsa_arctica.AAC.1
MWLLVPRHSATSVGSLRGRPRTIGGHPLGIGLTVAGIVHLEIHRAEAAGDAIALAEAFRGRSAAARRVVMNVSRLSGWARCFCCVALQM